MVGRGRVCILIMYLFDLKTCILSDFVFNSERFSVVYNPKFLNHPNSTETAEAAISEDLDIILTKFSKLCVFYDGFDHLVKQYIHLIPPLVARRNLKANNGSYGNVPRYQVCVAIGQPSYYEAAKTMISASDEANRIYNSTVKDIVIGCNFQTYVSRSVTWLNEGLKNISRLIQKAQYRYNIVGMFPYAQCLDDESLSVINSNAVFIDIVYFESFYNLDRNNPKAGENTSRRAIMEFEACERFARTKNLLIDIGFVAEFKSGYGEGLYNDCNLVSVWKQLNHWGTKFNRNVVIHEALDDTNFQFNTGWWSVYKSGNRIFYRERASTHSCTTETSEIHLQATAAYTNISEISLAGSHTLITSKPEISSTLTPKVKQKSFCRIPEKTSAIIGIFGVLFATMRMCMYMKKRRSLNSLNETEMQQFRHGNNEQGSIQNDDIDKYSGVIPMSLPYDRESYELQRGTFLVDETKILGEGAHGKACSAVVYKNETEVLAAAKTVKDPASVRAKRILFSEIKVLAYLGRHPNILELLGACTGSIQNDKIIVFTELCGLGSLDKLLNMYKEKVRRDIELPAGYQPSILSHVTQNNLNGTPVVTSEGPFAEFQNDMKRWAFQIANGMEYLVQKNVLHADLATRNVFITDTKQAKLADFGLSRRLYNFKTYVKTQDDYLPWQWTAPEALSISVFNEKTDVWSYGITLWEIFTLGDTPYFKMQLTKAFVSDLFVGLKPASPKYNLNDVYAIMLMCWEINPVARPNFESIKLMLVDKFGNVSLT